MDKRKLKLKSGLHKNLQSILSQTSEKSEPSVEDTSLSERRKRKISNLDVSRSDEGKNVAKKRRNESFKVKKKKTIDYEDDEEIIDISQDTSSNSYKTPTKSIKTRSNSSRKDLNNSRSITPLRTQKSKKKEKIPKKVQNVETQSKFHKFVELSGITLISNGPHLLCEDITTIKQKMETLLKTKEYHKQEIINCLQEYIEDENNIQSMLLNMEASSDHQTFNDLNSLSLVRTLLQIPELQPEIYVCFLNKLNESIILADSVEALPWACTLLQQFRFLETVVDPDSLSKSIEQLIETCPLWFQCELILYLPDIVIDIQHQAIAEILSKLMEENSKLTGIILDCITNLTLGKEYLEEFRNKVLDILTKNLNPSIVPALTRFVLNDCPNLEIYKNILSVLRNIDMQPLVGENLEECNKIQTNTIKYIKMNILLSKDTVNAALMIIKSVTKDPKPMDIILLLLISSTESVKKKNVDIILKQHVRSGFYRPSLLQSLYKNYKEIIRDLQPAVIHLASNLLKTEENSYIIFASEWFRLQFLNQADTVYKQREIIEKIILLMGNNDQIAKHALKILCKMTENEEEKHYLYTHCHHLRILLEKIDNLDLEEVGILSDLLHSLCTNAMAESLRDDLFILLQKQLSATKPVTKCKGVLGAVMAMKHLACQEETLNTARKLFKNVIAAVKTCPWSQALFYDELTKVIAKTENINKTFLCYIKNYFQEDFINRYMIDKSSYNGDLVPKFGLNSVENESENLVLNFENEKYGAIVPIAFKLLKTCCIRLSDDGELEEIDALLGCPILIPQNLDIPDSQVLDIIICCINWFREIISGFVTQTQPLLQQQILTRLDNLIFLQGELSTSLPLYHTQYQPTPCYFHQFPPTPFIKIEKKIKKKGKKESAEKSLDLEPWEVGSALCLKNPTYFRRMDIKITNLLDFKLDLQTSQTSKSSVSISQVCFLIKELLGIFKNDCCGTFLQDLIYLLPKICAKLREIVIELRETDTHQNREGARLILCLLISIFSWKGFQSATYNLMLRDALRTLASQQNETSQMLRSCKELVAESLKYFESLADIATQISLAIALVNACQSVMKHSESYTRQYKDKHAKMAFGFLCLQWPLDKHFTASYKTAIKNLIENWIEYEPSPLDTVIQILNWLPEDIVNLEKPQDYLKRLPSVNKSNFHLLYKQIFDGLIKGVKISLSSVNTDSERIQVWQHVALSVEKTTQICKTLKTKTNILIFLRYMPAVLRLFLNLGMPILEYNLKYQVDDVTKLVKMMQVGTKYLHTICCDGMQKKDITLTKYVPAAKSVLERLVYSVKGMLVLNNSSAAFWMGNLLNKNLEGQEICSQTSSSDDNTALDTNTINHDTLNTSSDILDSDSDDNPAEDIEENSS